MAFCNSCGAEMQPTMQMCPGCGSISGLIGGIAPIAVPGTPPATVVRSRGANMKQARRLLAVVCIIVSSVFAAGLPLSFFPQLFPPPNDADRSTEVVVGFMLVFCVFFSVRWYMKLSGRTHKVESQAWAAIFFWYSVLGILEGLLMMLMCFLGRSSFSPRVGEAVFSIFVLVGFPSGIWRERLRAAEKAVQASAV